jgi:hypothetical protein
MRMAIVRAGLEPPEHNMDLSCYQVQCGRRTQRKVAWEQGCRRQCRDWRLDGKIVMVAIPRAHTHAEAAVRRAE